MFRRSARAVQFDAYGGPEVLQLTGAAEGPAPERGDPAVKSRTRCGVRAQIANSRLGCG